MRAYPVAAAFSIVAASSAARAQSAGEEGIAPIVITADAPVSPGGHPVTATVAPTRVEDPATRSTVRVRIVSDAEPLDIAFVPYFTRIPADDEMQYICHTPCDVPIPVGTYHLVARNDAGRVHRVVDIAHETRFVVTPRRSRAAGVLLLTVGGASMVVGLALLVVALETSTSYAYGGYYRPDVTGLYIGATVLLVGGLAAVLPGAFALRGSGGAVNGGNGERLPPVRLAWSGGVVPLADGGALGSFALSF